MACACNARARKQLWQRSKDPGSNTLIVLLIIIFYNISFLIIFLIFFDQFVARRSSLEFNNQLYIVIDQTASVHEYEITQFRAIIERTNW